MIDDLALFFALRRLPEHNLRSVTGSVGEALTMSCEWDPHPRKVVLAAELERIRDSAAGSVDSVDRPGSGLLQPGPLRASLHPDFRGAVRPARELRSGG